MDGEGLQYLACGWRQCLLSKQRDRDGRTWGQVEALSYRACQRAGKQHQIRPLGKGRLCLPHLSDVTHITRSRRADLQFAQCKRLKTVEAAKVWEGGYNMSPLSEMWSSKGNECPWDLWGQFKWRHELDMTFKIWMISKAGHNHLIEKHSYMIFTCSSIARSS